MEYCEFIEKINSGEIKKMHFSVLNYPHYRNCVIEYEIDRPKENVKIEIITVTLTADKSEQASFYKTFKEDCKLFDFKRKGKFTLKQIWKHITINSVELNMKEGDKETSD